MSLRKSALVAAAAVSLLAVPTVASAAQASAASKLSVRAAPATSKAIRVSAARGARSEVGGSLIIPLIAAAAVLAGIIIASSGSDSP